MHGTAVSLRQHRGALAFGSNLLSRPRTCNLAAIIEMNTRIVSSHTVHLMPSLKQMMAHFVAREHAAHLTGQNRCATK